MITAGLYQRRRRRRRPSNVTSARSQRAPDRAGFALSRHPQPPSSELPGGSGVLASLAGAAAPPPVAAAPPVPAPGNVPPLPPDPAIPTTPLSGDPSAALG